MLLLTGSLWSICLKMSILEAVMAIQLSKQQTVNSKQQGSEITFSITIGWAVCRSLFAVYLFPNQQFRNRLQLHV